MKWCTNSPVLRDMQIKTTTRAHITKVWMAIINKSSKNLWWRGPGKKENFLRCRWDDMGALSLENSMQVPLKANWSYLWSTVPCLWEYPGKTRIQRETCLQSYTLPPVTRAKTWKPIKFPSRDECIKEEAVHVHNGMRLSHETEWDNTKEATHMNLVLSIQKYVTQKKMHGYHMISLIGEI